MEAARKPSRTEFIAVRKSLVATDLSRVTEMTLFHTLDVIVLEAAPERKDP